MSIIFLCNNVSLSSPNVQIYDNLTIEKQVNVYLPYFPVLNKSDLSQESCHVSNL